MKIKVEKSVMVDSLKKATSFIGIPKYDLVSICTDENKNVILKVPTMTKISKGGMFSVKISAIVEEEGSVIICAKKLFQIAKLLKGDTISIINDEGRKYIFVTDGHSKFNLLPQKGNFELPEIFYTHTIEVTAANFKNLINKISFASDKREGTNNIYRCINFYATNDGFLQISATNGVQIAYESCPCVQSENPVNFNAYTSEIQAFANILPNNDEKIKIEFGTSSGFEEPFARFYFGNFEFVTMLYDGKFPDIMQVVSFKKPTAILDTKEFKSTLDAMSLITTHCACNQVQLNFSGNVLKLVAESEEFGKCASTIDCFKLVESAFVSVNSIYLANALKQISSDKFPIIVTDRFIQITDGKFLYIVTQIKDAKKKLQQSEVKQVDPPTIDATTAA